MARTPRPVGTVIFFDFGGLVGYSIGFGLFDGFLLYYRPIYAPSGWRFRGPAGRFGRIASVLLEAFGGLGT